MTLNEAIEIAISLIREKAECDRLIVRLCELQPHYSDRHAVARFKRFNSAITILQGLKQPERENSHENVE